MKLLGKHINILHSQAVQATGLAVVLGAISSVASAGDDQKQGFTLAPSLGYLTHSESRQGAESAGDLSLAAGYQFNSPWALELAYTQSEPDNALAPGELDARQIRLDSLYHFGQSDKWQPYAVFGLGQSEITGGSIEVDETILNAGLGIKYQLAQALSLRSDVRAIHGTDTDTLETAFNLGVQFIFGDSKPAAKPQPAVAVAQAAPARQEPVNVDGDGDGVLDAVDMCPDTEAGAKVDDKGCYQVLKEVVVVELNIQFANNSDKVVSDASAQLQELAAFMRQFPLSEVEISGHTDDRGSAAYNKQLSQRRAQAVADILVAEHDIDAARITAKGYGEEQPIASNDTAEGRSQNRRVVGKVSATVEKTIK